MKPRDPLEELRAHQEDKRRAERELFWSAPEDERLANAELEAVEAMIRLLEERHPR